MANDIDDNHGEFSPNDLTPIDESGGAAPESRAPAVADDVLPDTLVLLPLPGRPFFPGQVQPIGLDPDQWSETLEAIGQLPTVSY